MQIEDRNCSEDEVVFRVKSFAYDTIHEIDLMIFNGCSGDHYQDTRERYYKSELDEFTARLAELSLTHTITSISVNRGSMDMYISPEPRRMHIYIKESKNHDTNITANTIDLISAVLCGMTFPNKSEITTVNVNGTYISLCEDIVDYINTNEEFL